MSFGSHHFDKEVERGFVIVEDEHIFPNINKLDPKNKNKLFFVPIMILEEEKLPLA